MTSQYICASAVGMVGATGDDATHETPACQPFVYDWTEEEAAVHGYAKVVDALSLSSAVSDSPQVWGSDEANAIVGTDGTQYRPNHRIGSLLPTYISDIYRTVDLIHVETYKWHGITLRRYGLQVLPCRTSIWRSSFRYCASG